MKKILVRVHTDGFVYCLYDVKNGICRIGKTDKKAERRIETQVSYYPYQLEVFKILVKNAYDAETYLHRKFRPIKLRADWYEITPGDFQLAVEEYKKQPHIRKSLPYKVEETWDYIFKLKQGVKRTTRHRIKGGNHDTAGI